WDGKNEGREDWLTQSSFPEFETGLAEVLHAERALIQEKNSLENLRQRVESAREQLRDCQKRVIDLRDEYNQVHEKLGLAKSSLDAIDYRSGWEELVAAEIDKKIAVIASEEWSGQVDNETTRLQERYDGKHPGKIVNDELRELAARLGADGTGKCFAKKLVWPKYLKLTEQFCKAAENDALTKCNQLLTELNRPTLRPALDPSADDVPDFPDSAFKSGQLLEHHAWSLKWLSKNHDGSTIKVHIEKIAKGWKHQIELRRDAWAKGFIVEHFSTYCEKRRQHFRGHVERLLAGFELESRPKNQAANVSEKIIEQMKEGLGGLELPIANSSASMPSMR
ncbi:MAG: hypothetical protein NT154_33600, partial [Verrucomicrobia bacterium]|nr:hypothetical protein [Verrucomicrobiota bacterium]